ncbi:hypothetical protein [Streptomyces sp. CA-111067]|uniref:hypothetical protein n=1 Tax=Streptomyces sp. CA-111067 TaxID=3240046 RepID=UPI003D99A014
MSEHLPEASFTAPGMTGQPSLAKGKMRVGETQVEVSYNVHGVSRASRALHLRYEDRAYTYESKPGGEAVELRRDGARIAMANGKHRRYVGFPRIGTAWDGVDEIDLAIALVLEAVEVSSLSLGGVIAITPWRLLNSPGDGGGE